MLTSFATATTLLLSLALLAHGKHLMKRSTVIDAVKHDAALHAPFLNPPAQPEHSTEPVVLRETEHNVLNGRVERTHTLRPAGICRSIDHVTTVESLACDDLQLTVRFAPGARPPQRWTVGTVLVGAEAWQCHRKMEPRFDGKRDVEHHEVPDQHEAFFRRIVAYEQLDDNSWRFQTEPEEGTICLTAMELNVKTFKPEHLSVKEYMMQVEELERAERRKRAENNGTEPFSIDVDRTFNLASVDINYNRWAEKNQALAGAIAMPTDLVGVSMRCLECWLKFHAGLDLTIKGGRTEPNGEWKFDLLRFRVFGKLSMAFHMSFGMRIVHTYRPELWIRASIMRMFQNKYLFRPTARFPVLSYLGLPVVKVFLKVDLSAMLRVGMRSIFRFSTGFRINHAELSFGYEKIGDGPIQSLNSASLDGEMIPFDFVLLDGSHGYSFLSFGPHCLIYPWFIGAGQIQRLINLYAWLTPRKRAMLPFPTINLLPALQLGTRFVYSHEDQCVLTKPEYGISVWFWWESIGISSEPVNDFYAPGRGISWGFQLNSGYEARLLQRPLAEPSCLFSLDLGGLAEGDVCDQKNIKCNARCAERESKMVMCRCMSGSLVQQCEDEIEPHITHPDGGVGGRVVDENGAMMDDAAMPVPRLDIAKLAPVCRGFATCGECATHAQCGWCASTESCMPGDAAQKPAQCFGDDWLYDTCFLDPQLRFTSIGLAETWAAGETKRVTWTRRLDVDTPSVALAYRWAVDGEWVLAARLPADARAHQFRVPDAVPATVDFQLMVLALPAMESGAPADDTPAITADLLARYGRAYNTSPLITVTTPLACVGPNDGRGHCLHADSCAAIDGTFVYATRRDPRKGCDQLPDEALRCCVASSAATKKKRASNGGVARIVTGLYKACPTCGGDQLRTFRPAYCLDGSEAPRLLSQGDDVATACHGLPLPPLEKSCGVLPPCQARPLKFLTPDDTFDAATNIALVGQAYTVRFEGGKLDELHELQLLTGEKCAASSAALGDDDLWQTVATQQQFSGDNFMVWNVPTDFVSLGQPQWTRLRVRTANGKLSAISSHVLVSHPFDYEMRVNNMIAPEVDNSPLGSDYNADFANKQSEEELEAEAMKLDMMDEESPVLGTVRLSGDVTQTVITFRKGSAKFSSHDIGTIKSVELTFVSKQARQLVNALQITTPSGALLTIEPPLANAVYHCEADGRCALDADGSQEAKATLPVDQACLFQAEFAATKLNPDAFDADNGDDDMFLDADDYPDQPSNRDVVQDNLHWFIIGGAALCVAIMLAVTACVVVRIRSNSAAGDASQDDYVYKNPVHTSNNTISMQPIDQSTTTTQQQGSSAQLMQSARTIRY